MHKSDREFDIIVYGATGFTGYLVAEYLLKKYGFGNKLRWAIAGRNKEKLEKVEERLKIINPSISLPVVLADSSSIESLKRMAKKTKVVCSTVGPYALHGTELVEACILSSTDYCDLSGEVQWIRKIIALYQDLAYENGSRIVHSCGFDCIPSDIGVWFLQSYLKDNYGVVADRIKYRIKKFRGSFSGGTIASIINIFDELRKDKSLIRLVADPYALNPKDSHRGSDQNDQTKAVYDEDFNCWTVPFIMASIDTRTVRRTNVLLDYFYGKDFRYDEAVLLSKSANSFQAKKRTFIISLSMAFLAIPFLRFLVKFFIPKQGDGPSFEERQKGFYDIRLLARHPLDSSQKVIAKIYGDQDPGYGSTAKIFGECAVCLAKDDLKDIGGIWTPASLMASRLLKRLMNNSVLELSIEV